MMRPESAQWALEQMEASGPLPEEAAILNEAYERLLLALPDPVLREIADRKLEGWTNAEIAVRTGIHGTDHRAKTQAIRDELTRLKWMSSDDGAH